MPSVYETLTPEQRSQRARIAAAVSWANTTDRSARGRNAQDGLRRKFEREARELHPDASEEHIAKAAESLYKAHFARITYDRMKKQAARKQAAQSAARHPSNEGGDTGAAA